jgi:hypothetical protein
MIALLAGRPLPTPGAGAVHRYAVPSGCRTIPCQSLCPSRSAWNGWHGFRGSRMHARVRPRSTRTGGRVCALCARNVFHLLQAKGIELANCPNSEKAWDKGWDIRWDNVLRQWLAASVPLSQPLTRGARMRHARRTHARVSRARVDGFSHWDNGTLGQDEQNQRVALSQPVPTIGTVTPHGNNRVNAQSASGDRPKL